MPTKNVLNVLEVPSQTGVVLTELQGFRQAVVTGAASGTGMAVAAIRNTDVIVGAVVYTNAAAAAPVDDSANITAQSLKATGTITVAAAANNDTATVNGTVFTFKDTPAGATDVRRHASDDMINAARLVIAINSHENRRIAGSPNAAAVVATSVSAVLTITATAEGTAGNAIGKVTSNNTRLATVGATLAGGASSGSIKSTTDLTGKTVVLSFYSKASL